MNSLDSKLCSPHSTKALIPIYNKIHFVEQNSRECSVKNMLTDIEMTFWFFPSSLMWKLRLMTCFGFGMCGWGFVKHSDDVSCKFYPRKFRSCLVFLDNKFLFASSSGFYLGETEFQIKNRKAVWNDMNNVDITVRRAVDDWALLPSHRQKLNKLL